MTLEEVKQRAMAIAAVDRTNVYIYQDRKFSTSLEPPKKHIGTFTYPYEQWEEAKS